MDDPRAERYAAEHKRFLQENRPDVWRQLQQKDPHSYLSSVGNQAAEMFRYLMHQYKESKEVRSLPYHSQVRALQSRQREVEELVLHDLILQPLKA